MSLSAILKAVEGAGYAPVIEVEFEEDHWKVKAYRDGQLLQLKIGLLAGECSRPRDRGDYGRHGEQSQ